MIRSNVVVELQGGLGNQLFGWAAGYVLSQKLNCTLVLDISHLSERGYQLDQFEFSRDLQCINKEKSLIVKISERINSSIFEEKSFRYDQRFDKILTPHILRGYFQSWKYHYLFESELYSKVSRLREESSQLKSLKNKFDFSEVIAIHVRRGDYKGLSHIHGIVGPEYYNRALRENFIIHQRRFPYIVFSDEPHEAKPVIPGAIAYIGPHDLESPAENLVLMSSCRALIGANSTFSLWAGLIMTSNSKTCIFPQPWFADESLDDSDLLPVEFIRLNSI